MGDNLFPLDSLSGFVDGYKEAKSKVKQFQDELEKWEEAARTLGEIIQKTLEMNDVSPDVDGRTKWIGTVNGHPVIRLLKSSRSNFDVKQFRADHPNEALKYTKQTVQYRIAIVNEENG